MATIIPLISVTYSFSVPTMKYRVCFYILNLGWPVTCYDLKNLTKMKFCDFPASASHLLRSWDVVLLCEKTGPLLLKGHMERKTRLTSRADAKDTLENIDTLRGQMTATSWPNTGQSADPLDQEPTIWLLFYDSTVPRDGLLRRNRYITWGLVVSSVTKPWSMWYWILDQTAGKGEKLVRGLRWINKWQTPTEHEKTERKMLLESQKRQVMLWAGRKKRWEKVQPEGSWQWENLFKGLFDLDKEVSS